ncbi:MAG TPA: alpha-ketoglutarate-dependent dioxygenase AlkB [Vicinamibacterales bacterium]|nr:alpha-ketoglutarate-dependent dioxygenase AlkB [Vicinamibacterales bacterium]
MAELLDVPEEAALLDIFRGLEFDEMRMRGVVARRRVLHYGVHYSFETFRATPGPPIPDFLLPLRERAAAFGHVEADALREALITEYQPGATIGWHRDAAPFDRVIGISLASACRFRFRRGKVRAWETREIVLPPRSAYLLDGSARREWEHSIPAVKDLRYSVTFRTLRQHGSGRAQPDRR